MSIASLIVELGINVAAFLDGCDKATYKSKQAAREIGRSFQDMGKEISGMLGSIGGDIGKVLGGIIGETGETLSKVSALMGSLGGAAGGAAIGLTIFGGAVVATGAAIGEMALEGRKIVDELDIMSIKTGIAIHDLQVFQAAGSTVGLSLEAMAQGFRRFDQGLTAMGRGTGQVGVTLKALGVTATDNKEALYQVADAFAKMEDGPRKAADAVLLFGRSGLQMIPFLDGGRVKLKEFEDIVDRYAPKIGTDAKEANDRFLISQVKLSLAWDSFKVSAVPVLDIMTKFDTAMADGLVGTHDLATEISGGLVTAIKSLGNALEELLGKSIEKTIEDKVKTFAGAALAVAESQVPIIGTIINMAPEHKVSPTAVKDDSARIQTARETAAELEKVEVMEAGGVEAYKLKEILKEIASLKTAGGVNDLIEAEKKLAEVPAQKERVRIEKELKELEIRPRVVPPSDIAGDMERKLAGQIANTVALGGVTDALTSSTVLLNAEEKARAQIIQEQVKLADERRKQEAELKLAETPGTSATSPAKAQELRQSLAENQRQSRNLTAQTPKIIEQTQQVSVLETVKATNKGLDESLAKMKQERDMAMAKAVSAGTPEQELASEVDKAVAQQTETVRTATEAYNQFAASHSALVTAMSPEKAALDAANEKLTKLRDIAAQKTVAEEVTKLTYEFDKQNTSIQNQIDSTMALADAYHEGGRAIVNAEISLELQKDNQEVKDLNDKLRSLGVITPENANEISRLTAALGLANSQLQQHVELLEKLKLAKAAESVGQQSLQLQGDAASLEIQSRNVLAPAAIQRQAAGASELAKFDVDNPAVGIASRKAEGPDNLAPGDVQGALDRSAGLDAQQTRADVFNNAVKKRDQEYQSTILQIAAQADLNKAAQDEVAQLEDASNLIKQNAELTAQEAASKYVANTPGAKEGDAGAMAVHDAALAQQKIADARTLLKIEEDITEAKQKARRAEDEVNINSRNPKLALKGVFDEISLEGENTTANAMKSLKSGVDGLESSIAKLIVTGNGGFKALLASMAEELIKLALQAGIAKVHIQALKAVQSVEDALGIGKKVAKTTTDVAETAKDGAEAVSVTAVAAAKTAAATASTALAAALSGEAVATAGLTTAQIASTGASAAYIAAVGLETGAIVAKTAAVTALGAANAANAAATVGANLVLIGSAEVARQAFIGEAAAAAAAAAGPLAIPVAIATEASLQGITALATGGDVEEGKPYIVGDGGRPELFVPRRSGTVVNNVPSDYQDSQDDQQPTGFLGHLKSLFTGGILGSLFGGMFGHKQDQYARHAPIEHKQHAARTEQTKIPQPTDDPKPQSFASKFFGQFDGPLSGLIRKVVAANTHPKNLDPNGAPLTPEMQKIIDDKYAADLAMIPGREKGGDISAGQSYLVGERGPEVVTPGSSGSVLPTDTIKSMSAIAAMMKNYSPADFSGRTEAPGAHYLASEARAQAGATPGSSTAPGAPPEPAQAGHTVHVNTTVNAVDASHFDELLDKHSRVVESHVSRALRHSNQRIG